jgi:quercetin dioxygenase-like cupin family protein
MSPRFVLGCALLSFCVTAVSFSQDAVKVDPKHYKVETENAQVRVLRVHYGPHEKSVLHSHPDSVAVFLTDGSVRFTDANGKTQDVTGKAGQAMYTPAQVHLPENTGDAAFELILVELKGPAGKAAAKSSTMK